MAAVTYGAIPSAAANTVSAPRKPGLFRRVFDRLVEARSRQAEAFVQAHLRTLDAETLARLGYDRVELTRE